jgi:hypothetical protein
MRIKQHLLFIWLCALAACLPWIERSTAISHADNFPGWPLSFEGKVLQTLPLTALEQKFADKFPGRIARFSDGQREVILRWVTHETRKLHPATDCFRGSGYEVHPLAIRLSHTGERWGRFRAKKSGASMMVEERIFNQQGQQWTDVSAWHWAALWRQSTGPWWAVTIAQKENVQR